MTDKAKVLITGNIPHRWLSDLEGIADPDIWSGKGTFLIPRSTLLSVIGNFDAVINFAETMADDEFMEAAKKLKIIANVSIGFDNLNLPLLTRKGVWAANAPGFFNYPVAEYVLAGILALLRRFMEADAFVRNDGWKAFEPGKWDGLSLKDQVIGIIGLGSIGQELKKMIESLGARVVYYNPSHRAAEGQLSFDDLISVSDIISIHVPLTTSTKNLIGKDAIARMKKGAILVNTSRGQVVDQNALVAALSSGRLSGAILDVFEQEPHVPEPLKKMKNVILTPHMAGGTIRAREACVRCAAKNVADALTGNRPSNALNNVLS
ncbi:MAG TPA: NAD(P)-dependent oxidoreductase [Puia sp.]|jgi:glyoxylate reductase